MKQKSRRVMVGIGFFGVAVIVLAIVVAVLDGYVSDATHGTGNLAPAAAIFLLGACIALVGFGSILFRRD